MKKLEKKLEIETKRKIVRILTIISVILMLVLSIIILKTDYFKVGGGFNKVLEASGPLAPVIFVLIAIAQTIFPIIPGGLSNTIGAIVFGFYFGVILNIFGMIIGSWINFRLGKKYGESLIKSFVDDASYEKYQKKINEGNKFKNFLFFGFLLPIFPDDIMCMVAGTSKLTEKEFMKIVILSRPISVFCFTFFTSTIAVNLFTLLKQLLN